MTKPLVSVVMVICDVERFLAESIESILGQTLTDFEFIIVDFGSTDNSKRIASKYSAQDNRIRLHEIPHCPLPAARNAACFLAQAKYVAIADADDVSLPNRLLWEVEFMEKHPEVGVLGGGVECISAAGTPLITGRHPQGDCELQSALLTHSVIWQPTALIRKEAFFRVGGYRTAFTVSHDYDLWLRIAEHYQIANLEQVVLNYRIHPFQVSLRKAAQQTLCKLAAQVSASSRRLGKPDPLDPAEPITPGLLVRLGVSEARQQSETTADYLRWVRHMIRAGEFGAALQGTLEFLRSPLEPITGRQAADLYLILAKLWWREGRFGKSLLAMARAVIQSPAAVIGVVKGLPRRLEPGLMAPLRQRVHELRCRRWASWQKER